MRAFVKAKAQPHAANVRVFCSSVGEGVAPEDFFAWSSWPQNTLALSDGFGVEELRAFNETLPVPYTAVTVWSAGAMDVCDVSFLTLVTTLRVTDVRGCALTLPTSVVHLEVGVKTERVSVSGTEHLTKLLVLNNSTTTTPCPALREFGGAGRRSLSRRSQAR